MGVHPVELPSRVVFSTNPFKREFAAARTMENHVRRPFHVQKTKCHLIARAKIAMKWALDFAQKMNCITKYVVVREEAVIAI